MKVIPDTPHGLNYLALSVSDEGYSRHASWFKLFGFERI